MSFGIVVDESVINFYVHILHLNDIGSIVDGYWRQGGEPPSDLRNKADNAALSFKVAEEKALGVVKNRASLDRQLFILKNRTGEA